MTEGALSHLKVLDLTHYIAGPYCTKLLAGMGAEVIKVERPDGGDPSRRLGPFPRDIPDPEKSGLYLYLNTNKKGITLNLKTESGKKLFRELVKDADMLVENFEPRVMPSLGLDYESLAKVNPKLVMTSISNFGQTGPYRDYRAQEINLDALGGLMYMTGDPEREPLKEVPGTVQYTAGANASAATLSAIYGQAMSNIGQHVDIAIMESAISLLDTHTLTWSRSRLPMKRGGPYRAATNRPEGAADNGVYPCRDGHIGVIFSYNNELKQAAILFDDEAYNDPAIGYMGFGKCVEDERLNKMLVKSLKDWDKEKLYREAQKLRLFWGAVRNIEEVRNNEHYHERAFWTELEHPRAGKLTYAKHPFIMSETPMTLERAPLFGEHNEEIFIGKLGYTREDLTRLRGAGAI